MRGDLEEQSKVTAAVCGAILENITEELEASGSERLRICAMVLLVIICAANAPKDRPRAIEKTRRDIAAQQIEGLPFL